MNLAKKQAFARKFEAKRLRLKKGGMVIRHYDSGGTILGGPGNTTNATTTGLGGIAQGLGLNASSANIQQGTNAAQLNNAYTGAQTGLNNQNNLANTLLPGAQTGVNTQNTLENQELNMAAGNGPNPAATQLAEATGQNVANQAALMAGQRGASVNPALIAREAAQTGAQTQQTAAGQAANLQANQEIAAQNNAANIAGQQVNQAQTGVTGQNTAEQNEQNILENANAAGNNAAVGMQSNINNVNAQASQGILGGITSGLSSLTGGLLDEGGVVGKDGKHPGKHKLEFVHKMTKMALDHFDSGGTVSAPPPPTPPIDPDKAKQVSDSFKSAFASGGSVSTNPLVAGYNSVEGASAPNIAQTPLSGPADLGQSMSQGYTAGQNWKANRPTALMNANNTALTNTFDSQLSGGPAQTTNDFSGIAANKGGEIDFHGHFKNYFSGGKAKDVPAMVSPGELYLTPEQVKKVIHEGADPKDVGTIFKGKAKVKGDSLKNDNIPVTLEEGGVIIDRKNMDKRHKRELFVHRALAKHKAGSKL